MRDAMDIAREITSYDEEEARKEIFNLIKSDRQALSEITKMYVDSILPDVLAIRNLVKEFNEPIGLDEKDGAKDEKNKKN